MQEYLLNHQAVREKIPVFLLILQLQKLWLVEEALHLVVAIMVHHQITKSEKGCYENTNDNFYYYGCNC